MAKKFEKKLLSSAMAVALTAGLGYAGSASAIHLAEDGVGQVLLAPFYYTNGYTTKFSIVNTREDAAVKAKITIRSAGHSQEALDFICYLTPADVCKFELMTENGVTYMTSTDDSVKQDDANPPVFASQVPVKQELKRIIVDKVDPNDSVEMGHVEIIGVYAAQGVIRTAPVWGGSQLPYDAKVSDVTVRRTMTKPDVARIFDTPRTTATAIQLEGILQLDAQSIALVLDNMNTPNESATRADGRMVNGVCITTPQNAGDVRGPCRFGAVVPTDVDFSSIRSSDPRVVRLVGNVEIVPNDGSDRMGYRIPALAGEIWDQVDRAYAAPEFNVTHKSLRGEPVIYPAGITASHIDSLRRQSIGVNGPFGAPFDGRVIASATFDETAALETQLGHRMGFNGQNVLEIEHALATAFLRNTYERAGSTNAQTQQVITFPTKYLHRGKDVCNTYLQHQVATGSMTFNDAVITYTPPFTPKGTVAYTMTAYDNQENSRSVLRSIVFSPHPTSSPLELPAEVNYFVPDWPVEYTSGWFKIGLTQKQQPTDSVASRGCDYAGVPALSLSHYYMIRDGKISNSWMLPNAHSPELINRQYNWLAVENGY